jgi:hypothetical protein
MTDAQRIRIQHDLLGRGRCFAACENGVFLSRLETNVVPIAVLPIRDGGIVLLQAPDDFRVDHILQGLGAFALLRVVGILRVQVCEHRWIAPFIVTQPIIGV